MKLKTLVHVLLVGFVALATQSVSFAQDIAETKTVTVNGEAPEVYYKRFTYKTSGKCYSEYGVYFHFLSTFHDSLTLPPVADGRKMEAGIQLYLNEDGTYEADYSELLEIPVRPDENRRYEVLRTDRISGRTQLNDEGQLELEGLGRLTALKYNDKPAAMLHVDHDLHTAGIRGQMVTMVMVTSTAGKVPYNKVCPGY